MRAYTRPHVVIIDDFTLHEHMFTACDQRWIEPCRAMSYATPPFSCHSQPPDAKAGR